MFHFMCCILCEHLMKLNVVKLIELPSINLFIVHYSAITWSEYNAYSSINVEYMCTMFPGLHSLKPSSGQSRRKREQERKRKAGAERECIKRREKPWRKVQPDAAKCTDMFTSQGQRAWLVLKKHVIISQLPILVLKNYTSSCHVGKQEMCMEMENKDLWALWWSTLVQSELWRNARCKTNTPKVHKNYYHSCSYTYGSTEVRLTNSWN